MIMKIILILSICICSTLVFTNARKRDDSSSSSKEFTRKSPNRSRPRDNKGRSSSRVTGSVCFPTDMFTNKDSTCKCSEDKKPSKGFFFFEVPVYRWTWKCKSRKSKYETETDSSLEDNDRVTRRPRGKILKKMLENYPLNPSFEFSTFPPFESDTKSEPSLPDSDFQDRDPVTQRSRVKDLKNMFFPLNRPSMEFSTFRPFGSDSKPFIKDIP